MSLFDGMQIESTHPTQDNLAFPQSLTEKYRPRTIPEFVGLEKQKRILAKLAARPFSSSWLFVGPSGTGKTTMAMALAEAIPAELHHVPSQYCTVATVDKVRETCQYIPMMGFSFHLVLVDEADQMTPGAQVSLLSKLDATNFPPNTIFIFTCNDTTRLEPRFLSRCRVLEFSSYGIAKDAAELLSRVWNSENGNAESAPNFARLVKESNNNVRESLMRLETELMSI